jgi:hypothetical protein
MNDPRPAFPLLDRSGFSLFHLVAAGRQAGAERVVRWVGFGVWVIIQVVPVS